MKNWKRLFFSFLLASMITLAPVIQCAFASGRLSGLMVGQFLQYHYTTISLTGNDTELIANVQLGDAWYNITVLDVADASVTVRQIIYNQTTVNSNRTGAFDVGEGSGGDIFQFAVAANLSAGDYIYEGFSHSFLINETVFADFLGTQMETNHMILTDYRLMNQNNYGLQFNLTEDADYYWDKRAGVMLLSHMWENSSRSNGVGDTFVTSFEAQVSLSSAIPPIPEFSTVLILPLFIMATLFAFIVHRKSAR